MNASLIALCVACVACSDVCADGGSKSSCEDTFNVIFSDPLEGAGGYELTLTGSRTLSCSFENPIQGEPDCSEATLIVERGEVVGLSVRGRIPGDVVFRVLFDHRELLTQTLSPSYRRAASDCSDSCAWAQARVDTANLAVADGSGGSGGGGGAPQTQE